jgi:hypothetical protein
MNVAEVCGCVGEHGISPKNSWQNPLDVYAYGYVNAALVHLGSA